MYRYKSIDISIISRLSCIDSVATWGLFLRIKGPEHESNNSSAI
jgi:hypothetical protein